MESSAAANGATFGNVEFTCLGVTLRGRLYLPETSSAPVVVMAHGFSATIPMVLDKYAEVFRSHGIAVVTFDFPGMGTSDGDPRGEINPWVSAHAYLSAIDAVSSMREVDAAAIALWGDSLSARVAFVVAALDPRVRALVCQVPAMGDEVPSATDAAVSFNAIKTFMLHGDIRRPPDTWTTMPVVSSDQASNPSALQPLTAFRWFIEHGGRYRSGWENRVVFTAPTDAPSFDPFACVDRVRVPTQFVMSPDDEMEGASSPTSRALFDLIPGSPELVETDGGHFGTVEFPSSSFDQASAAQADFLTRTLAP